jgi:ribosomal protein S18 acetylase RimI-like enzyme
MGPYADRLATLDGLMAATHPRTEFHAYLPFIGVDPRAQGRGIGGALLAARVRELDAARRPAYLEATTLRSAALYERYGFERLPFTVDLPAGPSLYPMWRKPVAP